MKLSIIVAMDKNHNIGLRGEIPWHIPEDLKHFQNTVKDHVLICGRKTMASLPHKYHNKNTVVISSRSWIGEYGCTVASNLFDAIKKAYNLAENQNKSKTIYIVGGGQVYKEALLVADEMIISHIVGVYAGDTKFPPISYSKWMAVKTEKHEQFQVIWWRRR